MGAFVVQTNVLCLVWHLKGGDVLHGGSKNFDNKYFQGKAYVQEQETRY